MSKPEFIEVQEQKRKYHFPTGAVEIENIISIHVSKSGHHRLNSSDGKKYIVPPGWLLIEFDAPDWSF